MNALLLALVFVGQLRGAPRGSAEAAREVEEIRTRERLEAERTAGAKVLAPVTVFTASRDNRTSWLNESYGTNLSHVKDKEWIESEIKSGRVKWKLTELSRTDTTVELRNETRGQIYRILDKRLELKDGENWKWLSNGHWEVAAGEKPGGGDPPAALRVKAEPVAATSPVLANIKSGGVYDFKGSFQVFHIVDDETMIVSYYFDPSVKLWALKGYKTKDCADGEMVKLPEAVMVDGTYRWSGNTIRIIRSLSSKERAERSEAPRTENAAQPKEK